MKKWIAIILAVCSMMGLCACDNSANTDNSAVSQVSQQHQLSTSPSSVTLYVGGSQKLNLFLDGQSVSLSEYNWKTENEKIAAVDPNGVVMGMMPGICHVTAFSTQDTTLSVDVEITVMSGTPAVESSLVSNLESSSESSDGSGDESYSESSDESSAESSDESSSEVSARAAANIFATTTPTYDKETLDIVHTYLQGVISGNTLIPTDGLTVDQAQMIVNTIYATYGYTFSVGESMNNSYMQCNWYNGTTSDIYEVINNMGDNQSIKDNIDNLGKYIREIE